MKIQLHEVTGKNRFCGPTAIATICGITTDDASRVVRSITGKYSVCFMSDLQMVQALKALGCTVEYHAVAEVQTANQWIQSNKHLFKYRHVILTHGRHYGTLLGNGFLCSMSERAVVGLKDIPKRKARVRSYFVVTSLPEQIGKISHDRFPLKPRVVSAGDDIMIVGHGLGALQDDPESTSWPSGRTIPLLRADYYLLERAMQWPEDLPQYDQMIAQKSQNALAA